MFLPAIIGVDGIWLSIVVAEIASMFLTGGFLVGLRKHYDYA